MSSIITLESPVIEGPLTGRALMLNTEKAKRFQCFGFVVTINSPIQIVPLQHQDVPLRKALEDKILLDVSSMNAPTAVDKTIQAIDKAVQSGLMDNVKEEDTGLKVLIGKDAAGNSYILAPKDEADYERMQSELKETGRLRVEKPKSTQFTGLSGVYELPIDRET
jgi:hypothetical protein